MLQHMNGQDRIAASPSPTRSMLTSFELALLSRGIFQYSSKLMDNYSERGVYRFLPLFPHVIRWLSMLIRLMSKLNNSIW